MADPELLLTVNGADVTADVWEWGSATLSDRIDAFASFQVTLRQAFGSVTSAPAFSDIRLVSLLTGAVLFDGVTTDGVTQRAVDPTWVETDIAATDRGVLLALSRFQAAAVLTVGAGDSATDALSVTFPGVIAHAYGDTRTTTALTVRPVNASGIVQLSSFLGFPVITWQAAQFDSLWDTLQQMADQSQEYVPGDAVYDHGFVLKWHPDMGLLVSVPSDAWRGAMPVQFTAAGFGRPAQASYARDDGQVSSGFIVTATADGTVPESELVPGDTSATNGYLVIRDTATNDGWYLGGPPPDRSFLPDLAAWYWKRHGIAAAFYQITTPEMPHDVQVGHSLTFDHPHFGTVTGTVQGVDTTFVDGLYFTDAQAWPEFLDAGLALDGTWNLDAARTRSIPRRARVSTITLSGNPRSFVKTLRTAGSI